MSDRPGKSRPMPAAPFDDPSIPVLTERLVLPALELDVTLPKENDGISSSAPTPVPALKPPVARDDPPPPALLGSQFETDDWLVETIPLAPALLDLSSFDLPPLDLPQTGLVTPDATPAPSAAAPVPAPATAAFPAAWTPPAPQPTPEPVPVPMAVPPVTSAPVASAAPESGFAATDLLIPASLIRVPGAPSTANLTSAPIESAPTFDRLPPATTTDALPPLETPGGVATAFAAGQAPISGAAATGHWTQLEIELRESILRDLLARLPDASVGHAHIAPAVESVVASATAQFATALRRALTDSLHDLVEQAVKEELARLRELKH